MAAHLDMTARQILNSVRRSEMHRVARRHRSKHQNISGVGSNDKTKREARGDNISM